MSTTEAPTPAALLSAETLKALLASLEGAAAAVAEAKRAAEQSFATCADQLREEANVSLRHVERSAQAGVDALSARVRDATPTLNDLEARARALAEAQAQAQAQAQAAPEALRRALNDLEQRFEQRDKDRDERISKDVDRRLRRVQTDAQESITALDTRVREATPTLNALEVRAAELSEALASAKTQADEAPGQLHRALAGLELQLAQRDAARTRAHDEARAQAALALKAREAEVSALILRLSAHLDNAKLREDAIRAAVRDEYARADGATKAQRDAEVTALVARLTQAEARANALLTANQALRDRVDALEERTEKVENKKLFGLF